MAPVLAMLVLLPLMVEGEVVDACMAATEKVNLEGGDKGNASLGGDFRHYCEGNPRNCRYVLMRFMADQGAMSAAFYHLLMDKELEMEGVKRLGELPIWVRVLLMRFVPACSLSYSLVEGKHLQMDPWDPEMSLWLLLFLGLAARELQLLFLLYIKGLVATYNRHRDENDETRLAALQEVLREVFRLEVETWKHSFWMVTAGFAGTYYIGWYIFPNWTWLTIWLLLARCYEKFSTIASLDLTSPQQPQGFQAAELLAALDRLHRFHQQHVIAGEEPRAWPSPFEPFPDLQRDRPPTPAVPPLPWMPSPLLIPESLDDTEVPEEFKCPISGSVMSQPAIWNGHSYEWEGLRDWVHRNDSPSVRDPKTGRTVDLHLIETEEGTRCYTFPPNSVQPNMALRAQIETFLRSNEASRGRPRTRASPSLARKQRNATPGPVASS